MAGKGNMKRRATLLMIVPLLYALVCVLPILWLVLTGFKSPADTLSLPPGIFPGASTPENSFWFQFSWVNYRWIFSDLETLRTFLNSFVIALLSTFTSVTLGTLAGYGFSRFRFKGSNKGQRVILLAHMVPPLAIVLPLSFLFSRLGIYDSHVGLILIYTCCNLSFATWMMKVFLDKIPTLYEDAARLDGYSRLESILRILLPHCKKGLTLTALLCFIASWNEYIYALSLTAVDAVTMPVRIHSIIGSMGRLSWGSIAAASTLFFIPLLALTWITRRFLGDNISMNAKD